VATERGDSREELDGSSEFSAAGTRRALEIACDAAGLDSRDAELLRIGENAIYRLASAPLVARIARTVRYLPAIEAEVAVTRWLESVEFPAVRLAGPAEQPVVADGRPVTFWELVAEETEYATVAELGALLRRLHGLQPPVSLELPGLRPFARVEGRVNGADLAGTDRVFMLERLAELRAAYARLEFALPAGLVHGDASIGNIIRRQADGAAVLIDWDGVATGPREWDLVLTAMYFERFGWHTGQEYREFVAAYGFDVMTWAGYPVLRDIRELIMVAWLAQNTRESPEIAAEVAKRIGDLRRGGDGPRDWAPF
jgi:aminoglycoside phosphotransferase (APT) family kinase protein